MLYLIKVNHLIKSLKCGVPQVSMLRPLLLLLYMLMMLSEMYYLLFADGTKIFLSARKRYLLCWIKFKKESHHIIIFLFVKEET